MSDLSKFIQQEVKVGLKSRAPGFNSLWWGCLDCCVLWAQLFLSACTFSFSIMTNALQHWPFMCKAPERGCWRVRAIVSTSSALCWQNLFHIQPPALQSIQENLRKEATGIVWFRLRKKKKVGDYIVLCISQTRMFLKFIGFYRDATRRDLP